MQEIKVMLRLTVCRGVEHYLGAKIRFLLLSDGYPVGPCCIALLWIEQKTLLPAVRLLLPVYHLPWKCVYCAVAQ